MSCALEIPEANVGRFRLCLFICFVLFLCFARGLAKAKCGGSVLMCICVPQARVDRKEKTKIRGKRKKNEEKRVKSMKKELKSCEKEYQSDVC